MSWKPCWHIQGHDRLVFDQCGPSLNTSGTLYNSYPQFQLTLRLGHLAPPNFQQASHTVVSQHRIPAPSAIPSKPSLLANPSLRVRAIWNPMPSDSPTPIATPFTARRGIHMPRRSLMRWASRAIPRHPAANSHKRSRLIAPHRFPQRCCIALLHARGIACRRLVAMRLHSKTAHIRCTTL